MKCGLTFRCVSEVDTEEREISNSAQSSKMSHGNGTERTIKPLRSSKTHLLNAKRSISGAKIAPFRRVRILEISPSTSTHTPLLDVSQAICDVPGCYRIYRGDPRWIITSLRRHKRQEHEQSRLIYYCRFCETSFTRSDNRLDHVRKFHNDTWKEGDNLG